MKLIISMLLMITDNIEESVGKRFRILEKEIDFCC